MPDPTTIHAATVVRLDIATSALRAVAGPIEDADMDIPVLLMRLDNLAEGIIGDMSDVAFGIAAELREIFAKFAGKHELVSAAINIAQGGTAVVPDELMTAHDAAPHVVVGLLRDTLAPGSDR